MYKKKATMNVVPKSQRPSNKCTLQSITLFPNLCQTLLLARLVAGDGRGDGELPSAGLIDGSVHVGVVEAAGVDQARPKKEQ